MAVKATAVTIAALDQRTGRRLGDGGDVERIMPVRVLARDEQDADDREDDLRELRAEEQEQDRVDAGDLAAVVRSDAPIAMPTVRIRTVAAVSMIQVERSVHSLCHSERRMGRWTGRLIVGGGCGAHAGSSGAAWGDLDGVAGQVHERLPPTRRRAGSSS